MNRIILKKINIGNKHIVLNDGMNIVIGDNATGKTLLFNLILYIMGLKKEIKINIDRLYFRDLYIDFKVSESSYRIEREINSNEIVFSGGINANVLVGSNMYYEIYNKILEPTFNFGEDKTAAIEILKASFLPGIKISRNKTDILRKILGINTKYLKKSKEQMRVFEQEIRNNENSYNILKEYMSNVSQKISNIKGIESQKIKLIEKTLKDEYMNLYERSFDDRMLINQSRDAYEMIRTSSDETFYRKANELEVDFQRICSKLGIPCNYRFIDMLENKRNSISISLAKDMLMQVIVMLILSMQNKFQEINSTGILVADSFFEFEWDLQIIKKFRNIIAEECGNHKLQYIEFTVEREDIPKDWVVCDLSMGGRLNWP